VAEFEIEGLRLDVPDIHLNDRIRSRLASGGYEGHEARAALMRLRAGQRVLELGSGIGFIACLCARVAGAENVATVEANPALLPVIAGNLVRNGAARHRFLLTRRAASGRGISPMRQAPKSGWWRCRIWGCAI
jgi:hypothetical protein